MTTSVRPLRIRPLPHTAPPAITVDQITTTLPPYVQDSLALDYAGNPVEVDEDDRFFDPQRTRGQDLPDPYAFSARLAQALVEVMAGTRPAPQVVRWTSPEVYAVLARRSLVAARRGLRGGRPPVVRRVRVSEVADGVAEVCVVVVHPDRVRAMALRLAGVDHRWVVTDLVLG